jgi:iron complex outermembrane receptor protein
MMKPDEEAQMNNSIIRPLPHQLRRIGYLCVVAGLLTTPMTQTYAQESDASVLEEIVVTAQRREESLYDVPIAITALSGDFLEQNQVFTAEALSLYTPSLHIFAEAVNTEFYTIRGIGRANEDLGSDSGVAVFIDDVYVARQGAANLVLFDVERAEVLRGPQGTLWGKNATGGAINVITRKPTGEIGGYIGADIGDYGTMNLRAAADAPLIEDTLNARVAFVSRERDGLYRNLTTGEDGNNVNTQAFRGTLSYTPSDATEVVLSADWARSEQDGVLKSVIVDVPGTLYVLKDFFLVTFPGQESDLRTSRSGVHGGQGIEQYGATLMIDHELSTMNLVSITGYRTEDSHHAEDNDRAPERSGDVWSVQDSSTFSQEFRLNSSSDGPSTWTAGFYWFHEEGDRDQSRYSDFFGPGGLIGPGSPEFQNSTTTFKQNIETDSFAVFGQYTYAFNDQWSVTLGGRYTDETKDYFIDAFAVPNVPGGDDFSLFIPDGAFTASSSASWTEFTPRVSVQFAPSDNINTYFSYSEGFKSGGYNGSPDNAAGVVPFRPEQAESYELGLKGLFFGGQMSANIAGFFTDYTDMQLQGFDPVTGSPITNNAASAEISGLEVEATGLIGDGFQYVIGASFLSHEFKDYFIEVFDPTIVGGPPFRVVDKAGDRIGLIPEYNYHVGLSYTWPLSGGGSMTLGGDLAAVDETITVFNTMWSNAYEVFDARLVWQSSGSWSTTLWVRNLFDEDYYRGGGPVPDLDDKISRLGLLADPQIFGISFDWRYGD